MRTNIENTTVELRTKITERGFTLIEIIMVLSIIALLIGAGIMHLANVGDKGKIVRVHSDFTTLRTALNLYQMDAGRYPSTEQGLRALTKKPTVGVVPRSYTPSLRKQLRDPWGSPYGYVFPSKRGGEWPDIYSFGKDAVEGTGDDIYMFDDEEEDDE